LPCSDRARTVVQVWPITDTPDHITSPHHRFDHAAQFFTVTDPLFQSVVDGWLRVGLVKPWSGPVGTLRGGAFKPLPASPQRYVAADGMRGLAEALAERLRLSKGPGGAPLVELRRPCWVGKMQVGRDQCFFG
jgi:hypothetical protein